MKATPLNTIAKSDGFYHYEVDGDRRRLSVRPERGLPDGWFAYVGLGVFMRRVPGHFSDSAAAVAGGLLWMQLNPPPPKPEITQRECRETLDCLARCIREATEILGEAGANYMGELSDIEAHAFHTHTRALDEFAGMIEERIKGEAE